MKMAKRILSLVLVLVMFASLSVTAFAMEPLRTPGAVLPTLGLSLQRLVRA